ncbi:MAG TPA: PLP-dependent aminotransferase family protein [Polyangiaceae bacterium]|nr:PLP-dependent aminotransferase family protein [Polyangiaceae bacterium]
MERWIESLQRRAATQEDGLPLSGGLPLAELFPQKELLACHAALSLEADSSALQYTWPEGSEALRTWIAARLRKRGANTTPADVIITTGAQQALVMLCAVLKLEGRRIGVDAATYSGALDVFRRARALPVVSTRAAAIYAIPGSSNPEGRGLGAPRRAELLEAGCPIIADEAYAELRYDGVLERPLIADAPDRVFHVGTLSKTLCPGLRLGWLVAPSQLRSPLLDAKRDLDLQAPSLSQALVERLLNDFDWDAHLEVQRREYRARMATLMGSLRRHLPELEFEEPEGGFTLFVRYAGSPGQSPSGLDEPLLLDCATRHGTSFDPGSMFQAEPAPLALRLSPCGVGKEQIDSAVQRLAAAFSEARDRVATKTAQTSGAAPSAPSTGGQELDDSPQLHDSPPGATRSERSTGTDG